jgi:hypothetical protein
VRDISQFNLGPGADPDRCQRCECIGQNWEIMLLEIIYRHIILSSILSQALSNRLSPPQSLLKYLQITYMKFPE